MKIDIYKIAQNRPSLAGEILRELFFKQNKNDLGCYSTFELNEDVVKYPNITRGELVWNRTKRMFFPNETIEMQYVWDGDGTLIFIFVDGSYLINTDCKKDYDWKYHAENFYENIEANELNEVY